MNPVWLSLTKVFFICKRARSKVKQSAIDINDPKIIMISETKEELKHDVSTSI